MRKPSPAGKVSPVKAKTSPVKAVKLSPKMRKQDVGSGSLSLRDATIDRDVVTIGAAYVSLTSASADSGSNTYYAFLAVVPVLGALVGFLWWRSHGSAGKLATLECTDVVFAEIPHGAMHTPALSEPAVMP